MALRPLFGGLPPVARLLVSSLASARPSSLTRGVAIAFSTAEGGADDDFDAGAAIGSDGWDPTSIERRVRRKRRGREPGQLGRSETRPSEEDAWAAAGVYDALLQSQAPPQPRTWAAPPPPFADPSSASSPGAPPAGSAPAAAPVAASCTPAAAPVGSFLALSSLQIPKRSLPGFVRTFQLLALPAYAGLPGCLGARLLTVTEGGADAAAAASVEAAVEGSAEGLPRAARLGMAGRREELVRCSILTEWANAAYFDAAGGPPEGGHAAYREAMQQLGTYVRGTPDTQRLSQDAASVFWRGQ